MTEAGFQRGTFADSVPIARPSYQPSSILSDAESYLPAAAARRLTALKQRASDLHVLVPPFQEVSEVQLAVTRHQQRIRDLTQHPSEGGRGLGADEPQVVSEQRLLDRASGELQRLKSLQEIRSLRWNGASQLAQSVTDWLRTEVRGDCTIEAVDDAPLSDLLEKTDGGRIEAAVQRCRLKLKDLTAGRHRLHSALWPSAVVKAAAKALIDRLADAGAPDLDAAIKHGRDISFATTQIRSMVHNVPNAGAVAYAEVANSIGLICWLWRTELLKKISAGLDELSDDKSALGQAQREQMEAEITTAELAVSRAEVALIRHAEARGEVIDFRSDTSPQSLLGVRLVTRPTNNGAAESSAEMSWPITTGGGR